MAKRLTAVDLLIVCGLMFTLVVGIGAFFGGLYVGKTKTETQYRELILELADDQNQKTISYHQKQLVQFYYGVWQPYTQFSDAWFAQIQQIQPLQDTRSGVVEKFDVSLLAQEIEKALAKSKATIFPDVSPLLTDAKKDYVRSLQQFATAVKFLAKKPTLTMRGIEKEPHVIEGETYALRAQAQFYEAIRQWDILKNKAKNDHTILEKNTLPLLVWRTLSLNSKNTWMAKYMLGAQWFTPYFPHDVVSRIDALDAAGKLSNKTIKSLTDAITMIKETDAVRLGDFLAQKEKLYPKETLPLLPVFLPPQ
jgi:hypothetical protein